jgi:translocation protein SEC66
MWFPRYEQPNPLCLGQVNVPSEQLLVYNVPCLTNQSKQANAYSPGWGQTIFQSANEMMNNDIYRKRMDDQQGKLEEERQWWSKKKSSIQEGFMKELEESSPAAPSTSATKPAGTMTPARGASVQGSDDDAVLVEAETSSSIPVSPPSAKKKKGKGKK